MTLRTQPVIQFAERPAPGPIRRIMDVLQGLLGKVTSLATLEFLSDLAGYQIVNAAAAPGTDIPEARTAVNLGDAGIDQIRLVVRGHNSAAGSVMVQIYRVTGGLTIASVTVTDATIGTFQGDWTVVVPTGADEHLGLRIVGDGAFDPTLYRVDLQMRTLRGVA